MQWHANARKLSWRSTGDGKFTIQIYFGTQDPIFIPGSRGLCISASSFVSLRYSVLPTFKEFEYQQSEENFTRFHKAMERELAALALLNQQYAERFDTHEYIRGGRPDYVEENLSFQSIQDLNINLILIFNLNGELVWGIASDVSNDLELPAYEPLLMPLALGHPLLPVDGPVVPVQGLLRTKFGPMLVSSRQILRTQGEGASVGTFIMGKYLGDKQVNAISQLIGVSVSLSPVPAGRSSFGVEAVSGPIQEAIQWEYRGRMLIAREVLSDVFNAPVSIIEVATPRHVTAVGRRTIASALLFLFLGGAIIMLASWWIIRHLVFRPMAQLKGDMRTFRRSGEVAHQGEVLRSDEIGDLTNEIYLLTNSRKETEEELYRLAYHDELTGLPNRRLFSETVAKSLPFALRNNSKCAVCIVDLDSFKVVNDTLGHTVGDVLLKEVSDRLAGELREGDSMSVRHTKDWMGGGNEIARLGGDEFLILLVDFDNSTVPAKVADRLLRQIALPINVEGQELNLTASIGISVYPTDGNSLEVLMRNADGAMYDAKRRGKNTFAYYKKENEAVAIKRLALETGLRKAIENHELELHYQPQVDIGTGRIIGAEALLRWLHPKEGMISPAEFIPVAEETALIIPIGEWVLRQSINQIKAWQHRFPTDFKLSVNISGMQMREDDFLTLARTLLQDSTGLRGKLVMEGI